MSCASERIFKYCIQSFDVVKCGSDGKREEHWNRRCTTRVGIASLENIFSFSCFLYLLSTVLTLSLQFLMKFAALHVFYFGSLVEL